MFEGISAKLAKVFKTLKGQARLTEKNIEEALTEVRIALLEADVNFKVVKSFIEGVRARAVGIEVLDSITPGQQVIKIVHEEMVELLGETSAYIRFGSKLPAPIILVGLQGCGKTTSAAKLAHHLIASGKRTYLIPADIYRPAAVEQLHILAKQIGTEAFLPSLNEKPAVICSKALNEARRRGYEVAIIDTAGRNQLDETMMWELREIVGVVKPAETLFVADAMLGQEAINVATAFHQITPLDGVIMTKMDSDARGGAALSLKAMLGKPIKFIGVGEKTDALERFHPERIAGRILGMGDVVSLVEKAQKVSDEQGARTLEQKLRKGDFSLADFREQLKQVRKLGSLQDVMGMIPGMGKLQHSAHNDPDDAKGIVRTIAIIDSMTKQERLHAQIIDGSRRKRIASGSGTTVQDVNHTLKQYESLKKMLKMFSQKGNLGKLAKRHGVKFPFQ